MNIVQQINNLTQQVRGLQDQSRNLSRTIDTLKTAHQFIQQQETIDGLQFALSLVVQSTIEKSAEVNPNFDMTSWIISTLQPPVEEQPNVETTQPEEPIG